MIFKEIRKEDFTLSLEKLPKPAREYLASQELSNIIFDLGKKSFLHVNQMGNLSKLVVYTATGLLPSEKFKTNLRSIVDLSEDQVNLLIYEINQQVFLPIKNKMYFEQTQNSQVDTEPNKEGVSGDSSEEKIVEDSNNKPLDTFSQKMTTEYGLPREKMEISDHSKQNEAPKPPDTPPLHDPYREPID